MKSLKVAHAQRVSGASPPSSLGRTGSSRIVHVVRSVQAIAAVFGFLLSSSCGEGEPQAGSETHFLSSCSTSCADGFVCNCGVCTQACTESSLCSGIQSEATCVAMKPRVAEQRCPEAVAAAYCDVGCATDSDCGSGGDAIHCVSGYCRTTETEGNAQPPPACTAPDDVAANQIVVMGDSLFELSGFADELEAVTTAQGALSTGDHYRDYASATTSFLAEGQFSLATQYTAARSDGTARVVIMNGGATDMLQNPCPGALTAACPEVQAALLGAEQLFERMFEDGVEHVVYLSYPYPRGNASLRAGYDVLRPVMQNVCGKSPIACHFLDLRPVFQNHDEYIDADGIVFTKAGARATATALWDLMQTRCIPR